MQLSFRQVLVLNQVPIWLFSVLIVGVTLAVLSTSWARVEMLVIAHDAGRLDAAALQQAGAELQAIWLLSLLGFGVFASMASLLSAWVYRHVAVRAERLSHYLRATTEGSLEAIEAPARIGHDALSELEQAVVAIALRVQQRDEALALEANRGRFEGRLQRALDLTDSEEEALAVAEEALHEVLGDAPFEVLLADSSDAHLRAAIGSACSPGCPVSGPRQCAAIRRGQTLHFPSSQEIDACPKLRIRGGGLSALCAPVTVMGRTIGVLHATGPEGHSPAEHTLAAFGSIAMQVGTRISALRTLASSELQAQTDPMTGVPNRRSFEARASARLRSSPSAADTVLMIDIDHFKKLNDTAGHDAGDRALMLFSSVLKGGLQGSDLVGRYGGEEFVVMLLDCDELRAKIVVNKLRQKLAEAVLRYGGPRFTASFGAASTDGLTPLQDLIARADGALYEAKRRGRDRLVTVRDLVSGEEIPGLQLVEADDSSSGQG